MKLATVTLTLLGAIQSAISEEPKLTVTKTIADLTGARRLYSVPSCHDSHEALIDCMVGAGDDSMQTCLDSCLWHQPVDPSSWNEKTCPEKTFSICHMIHGCGNTCDFDCQSELEDLLSCELMTPGYCHDLDCGALPTFDQLVNDNDEEEDVDPEPRIPSGKRQCKKPKPTPRPGLICAANVKWVCGCDGKNYQNSCKARRGGSNVKHEGKCSSTTTSARADECEKPQLTPRPGLVCKGGGGDEWVCGCDGKTYSTSCKARSAGSRVKHEGKCSSSGNRADTNYYDDYYGYYPGYASTNDYDLSNQDVDKDDAWYADYAHSSTGHLGPQQAITTNVTEPYLTYSPTPYPANYEEDEEEN